MQDRTCEKAKQLLKFNINDAYRYDTEHFNVVPNILLSVNRSTATQVTR